MDAPADSTADSLADSLADSRSGPVPWLSILIPVYNVSAFVEACLHSVLHQIGADTGVEVLVLDDCGNDDSWQKVERIASRYPGWMRLLRHPCNQGLSAARNHLLAAACGRYVWFLDSDDVLMQGVIAQLREVVGNTAADLVLCDFRVLRQSFALGNPFRAESHRPTFQGSHLAVSSDRSALVRGVLEARQLHAWSKIARRHVWQQAPFPEGRYFEDITVFSKLAAASERWIHVPAPWVGYRQRDDSIVASMTPGKVRDLLASLRELREGARALPGGLDKRAVRSLDYFCLRALANLARSLPDGDPGLDADCRQTLATFFPDSPAPALAQCRQRGWWLRAARAQGSLAQRGWLR